MFESKTDEEIISMFRCYLREGIEGKPDGNYATDNRSLILLVAPDAGYFEIYSYGALVFRLEFESDNRTWKESFVGEDKSGFTATVIREYKEAMKEEGLHAIPEKKKKFLS